MSLWDKFCKSGKIEDYLNYTRFEKGAADDDNRKGSDLAGK